MAPTTQQPVSQNKASAAPRNDPPVIVSQPKSSNRQQPNLSSPSSGGLREPLRFAAQAAPPGTPAPAPEPKPIPGCPPGLEYLTQLDEVIVAQQFELVEILCPCETTNKYKFMNSARQQMYWAEEESGFCVKQCCGPVRPFDLPIVDNFGKEVIHLYRPYRCANPCCFCCLQKVEVSDATGVVMGTVQQKCSWCYPTFHIKDGSDKVVLRIKGPICTASCCCQDIVFKILYPGGDDDNEVGKISKHWSGFLREAFTDADFFSATFPMDLDVKMKATMLGALILIDFMFFEEAANRDDGPDLPGMAD